MEYSIQLWAEQDAELGGGGGGEGFRHVSGGQDKPWDEGLQPRKKELV